MPRRLAAIGALVVTAVLVILGVKSFYEGTAQSRPAVMPFEFFWCAKDEDCVVVNRIGCCSCAEGGGQAAITRWRGDDLRLFLKGACRPQQVCVQVNVCLSNLQARCVKRLCTVALDHE